MDKKIILVQASVAEKMRDALDAQDAWDLFDLVVVPDGELTTATDIMGDTLPDGQRLRTVDINDFIK